MPRPTGRHSATLAAAAVLTGTLLLHGCGGEEAAGDEGRRQRRATVPSVEVVQARRDALPLRERLTGTVQASGQVSIVPEVNGRIVEVLVADGEAVRAGQPLVRIEAAAARSQLDQAEANLGAAQAQARAAEANLAELESQFERTRLLAADSLVSRETLETQRAQVESARAAVEQARAGVRSARATIDERREAVSRTVVRAPIGGVVGQRRAEVGMIADGQTPLFTIGRLDAMQVEVPVAQDLLGRIEAGQRVEIRTDAAPGEPVTARLSRLSPFLAQGSFSAEAEIDVPDPDGRLVPGMFVTVDVFWGEADSTTVVPTSAVYEFVSRGQTGVFVAGTAPDHAPGSGELSPPTGTRFVPVEVVAEGPQSVGIRGVEPGAWVVVIGQSLLSENTGEEPTARLRAVTWDRIVELQRRQGRDLLLEVLEEHDRG
jgi:RND family efflux transporter MFP subunit